MEVIRFPRVPNNRRSEDRRWGVGNERKREIERRKIRRRRRENVRHLQLPFRKTFFEIERDPICFRSSSRDLNFGGDGGLRRTSE